LFPDVTGEDILSTHVFRAPYVEPIWTPGYSRRVPPFELVPGRVYLATTAQVYPNVTSWNTSIRLATGVANRIVKSADAARSSQAAS
jgi:protoporphyrinogen oxidase